MSRRRARVCGWSRVHPFANHFSAGVPGVARVIPFQGKQMAGVPRTRRIHTPISASSAVPAISDDPGVHRPSSPHHLVGTVWPEHVRYRNAFSLLPRACDPAVHQLEPIPRHEFTNDLEGDHIGGGGPVWDDQSHLDTGTSLPESRATEWREAGFRTSAETTP